MAKLVDSEADEVLRHARAHMDPTVFDRARVARKLAATRLAWDGQHAVGGEPLPQPFSEGRVAATALKASKLRAIKWALALASVVAVGAAALGEQAARHYPSPTASRIAKTRAAFTPRIAAVPAPVPTSPQAGPSHPVSAMDSSQMPSLHRKIARMPKRPKTREPLRIEVAHQPHLPKESSSLPAAQKRGQRDPLSLDVRLLQQAAQALYAGQPRRALTLLSEHADRFATSETRHERHALAFQAACALGERAAAEAYRLKLLHEAPDSALSARVRDGCVDRRR